MMYHNNIIILLIWNEYVQLYIALLFLKKTNKILLLIDVMMLLHLIWINSLPTCANKILVIVYKTLEWGEPKYLGASFTHELYMFQTHSQK